MRPTELLTHWIDSRLACRYAPRASMCSTRDMRLPLMVLRMELVRNCEMRVIDQLSGSSWSTWERQRADDFKVKDSVQPNVTSLSLCLIREMPLPKELSATTSPTQKQPRSEVDRGHPCPRLCARTCDALVAHYASLPTSKLSAHLAENNGDRWSGISLPEMSFPTHWHFFIFFIPCIYLFLINLFF